MLIEAQLSQPKTSWIPKNWEIQHAAIAGLGSFFLCYLYYLGTKKWSPGTVPGALEFWATMTSLWCVWITQKRNILSMPIGIVSVILMGKFFGNIGLTGQQLLQWVYYVPVQIYGWYMWRRGGEDNTELVVTRSTLDQRVYSVVAYVFAGSILGVLLNTYGDGSVYTFWDASIVAASIVAQYLLTRKKWEAWVFWILPVNIAAIALYLKTDANMFAALYMLFLAMAFGGLYRWHTAYKKALV